MPSIPQKQCTKCGHVFPATTEFFNKNCKAKDGLHPNCKSCRRTYRNKNKEHIYLQKKSWRENNPEKEKARVVKWIEENKERHIARKREYYFENKPRFSVMQKEYYLNNHDAILTQMRLHYQEHRQEICTRETIRRHNNPRLSIEASNRAKKWRENNPEHYKQLIKEAKNKRRNAPGKLSRQDFVEMYDEQTGHCCFCGIGIFWDIHRDIHLEHYTPISRNGTNLRENVGLSCQDCNLNKQRKTVEEWMEVRGW